MKSKLLLSLALLSCSIILSNCGCCGKKEEPKEEVRKDEVATQVPTQEVVVNPVETQQTPVEK